MRIWASKAPKYQFYGFRRHYSLPIFGQYQAHTIIVDVKNGHLLCVGKEILKVLLYIGLICHYKQFFTHAIKYHYPKGENMIDMGTQILRISKALQPNNFWTISSAYNHCGCKKWSLTLRWGRDTQSFVVCRAHSGQHKSNWTLVEDAETFFASEIQNNLLVLHLQTTKQAWNSSC